MWKGACEARSTHGQGIFRTCGSLITLSMHNNEEYAWQALKAARPGYLLKKAATAELETACNRWFTGTFISAGKSPRDSSRSFPCKIADQKGPLDEFDGASARKFSSLLPRAEHQTNRRDPEGQPKTIEYHRMKLMGCLNIHDVPAWCVLPCGSDCFRRKMLVTG